jgi:hypothetical protein
MVMTKYEVIAKRKEFKIGKLMECQDLKRCVFYKGLKRVSEEKCISCKNWEKLQEEFNEIIMRESNG